MDENTNHHLNRCVQLCEDGSQIKLVTDFVTPQLHRPSNVSTSTTLCTKTSAGSGDTYMKDGDEVKLEAESENSIPFQLATGEFLIQPSLINDMERRNTLSQPLQTTPIRSQSQNYQKTEFESQPLSQPFSQPMSQPVDREIEGVLVEKSLSTSLPEVVNEVARSLQGNMEECEVMRNKLHTVTEKYKQLRQQLTAVTDEQSSVRRRLYLTQQSISSENKEINKLQTEIHNDISSTTSLNHEEKLIKAEVEETKKTFAIYSKKMEDYKQAVLESEQDTTVHRELVKELNKLEELRNKKISLSGGSTAVGDFENITSGKSAQQLTDEIKQLKKEKQELDELVKARHNQVKKEVNKQKQLKQETAVLHKRNSAQMLCLKRQVKEHQGRNKQYREQANGLRRAVEQAQRELERKT